MAEEKSPQVTVDSCWSEIKSYIGNSSEKVKVLFNNNFDNVPVALMSVNESN